MEEIKLTRLDVTGQVIDEIKLDLPNNFKKETDDVYKRFRISFGKTALLIDVNGEIIEDISRSPLDDKSKIRTINEKSIDSVDRLEVISSDGRLYTDYYVKNLKMQLQDKNKTLKIFTKLRKDGSNEN